MFADFSQFLSSHPKFFLAMIVAIGCLSFCGCLWLWLRYWMSVRKLIHAERMKLIENGQSAELLKHDEGQASHRRTFWMSIGLGLLVPCAAIGGATGISNQAGEAFATALVAWICGLVLSAISTICATIVASRDR